MLLPKLTTSKNNLCNRLLNFVGNSFFYVYSVAKLVVTTFW